MGSPSKEQEKELAQKLSIVEASIEMRIESLGGKLNHSRKAGLLRLPANELHRLAQTVKHSSTYSEAISAVVCGISGQVDIAPPDTGPEAETSMDL